jgi:hypothetical protein
VNCEDCELTLPCYAGKLTPRQIPLRHRLRVHCCPNCTQVFIVHPDEKWWDYIECDVRSEVVKEARVKMCAGFAFDQMKMRDYRPSGTKLIQMLDQYTVDDPGPGEVITLFCCPTCCDPVVGKGVVRYIGVQRRWLFTARQIDAGRAHDT